MCPAPLNHGSPSVCLHPALFPLSPPLSISLSVRRALQALLTKTLLITYQNYPNSLLTCPASLSLSLSFILTPAFFFISLLLGTVYSPLPPPFLLIHPCKACRRAILLPVSLHPPWTPKSPRGISDSLADLPLLPLKTGWLRFFPLDFCNCQLNQS